MVASRATCPFGSGEKVSLESRRGEGEEYTEFEKFRLTYKDQYAQDVR